MLMKARSRRMRRTVWLLLGVPVVAATAALLAVDGSEGPQSTEPAVSGAGAAVRVVELVVPTRDGLRLPATLRLPAKAREPVPGMVLVHGAGASAREHYRTEAEAFAEAGVATLAYDRRSVGYSLTERSYSRLADDAVAAARVLRAQSGVDPRSVGLWGLSEGGWVAPLAAFRAPDTAFLIVVGANGVGPLRQQVWAEAVKLESAGIRGSLVDAASAQTYGLIDALGLFPEAFYDPGLVLEKLTLPVLGIWGALDRSTPPVESVALFRDALHRAGNQHYVLRTIDGASHSLRTTSDGFRDSPDLVTGYRELIGSWVAATTAGRPWPVSVVGVGHPPRPTADVQPASWYEGATAHAVVLAVMVGGFTGFGVVAVIRWAARRFGRANPALDQAAPRSARLLAGAGLATVVGALLYLAELAVVRGGTHLDPGLLLLGRTLLWLALQLLAVTTVLAAIALAIRLVRSRPRATGEALRLGLLLFAGAAFAYWSVYWGLIFP